MSRILITGRVRGRLTREAPQLFCDLYEIHKVTRELYNSELGVDENASAVFAEILNKQYEGGD